MKDGYLSKVNILWLLVGFLLAACSQPANPTTLTPIPTASNISLIDGLGREVHLPSPAQRIISLAPSNTEILYAIGAGSQLVGRDTFSDYPEESKQLTDIGGGFGELNTETIVALKPDLVLTADLTPTEQIQALENLGLTVYALPNPSDFDGMFDNLKTVSILTGHELQAESVITKLRERVTNINKTISLTSDRPLVFYELDITDPNAPFTSGPGTFIDTLIRMAGGENLGSSLEGTWVQISLEELIVQDPDIIILGDFTWGGVTPEQVRQRAGWDVLKAVKESKLYTFDDNLVSRPGPRLVDGLEAMAKLLHPELFE
jgi:iron complex transport system substrate-binding protein